MDLKYTFQLLHTLELIYLIKASMKSYQYKIRFNFHVMIFFHSEKTTADASAFIFMA